MASRARSFGWFAVLFAVFVWILCAVPLAAPSQVAPPQVKVQPDSPISLAPEQPAYGVPATADALLEQMSLAAGVIFAGQVTAVRRPIGFTGSGQDAAEGIVEIDLRVGQSLRGPVAGSTYTLREWSGLWSGLGASNSQRYRPGERLLLFLYAPDAHGLSAPVHGPEGAIPLRGSGVAPGPDDFSTAAAEWLVDLRWLQAQALRKHLLAALPVGPPVYPEPVRGTVTERGGDGPVLESDPSLVRAIREPWLRPAPAPVEVQPLSQVLALCREAITLNAMRHRDAAR
jgi:hypothetical protein